MFIGDLFGLLIFIFIEEKLVIVVEEEKGGMFFNINNVSYSNRVGILFCLFNGKGVYNKDYVVMVNGDEWFDGDFLVGWLYF